MPESVPCFARALALTVLVATPAAADPLTFSTYLGGSLGDGGNGTFVAVDGAGYVYLIGDTESPDFPTTPGAFDTSHNGADDVYVAKLAPDGSSLVFATYLGGSVEDRAQGMALDADGSIYVTGYSGSTDFPTTAGALATTPPGGSNGFVTKLSNDGSRLLYGLSACASRPGP